MSVVFKSEKLDSFSLETKLKNRGWRGKYYGVGSCVSFLTPDNKLIAEVYYDSRRSLITSVIWHQN